MIGVTFGIGEEWAQLARRSALAMETHTGIPCHVIETDDYKCCHPSWLKCHVHRMFPEADSFLVFDADLLCVAFWDPEMMFHSMGRPFIGVPEPHANHDLLAECRDWGLGYPDLYLNAGLLIFGREHGFVFDRAWTHHPHGGRWIEQTAINHALAMEAVEVCRLPRHFNVLAQDGKINSIYCRSTLKDAINVHTCAMPDAASILEHHRKLDAYLQTGLAGRTRQQLLEDLPKGSIGAEIGVFCGDFSRDILRIVQPERLHLVDLFQGQVTSGDVNGQHMRTVDMAVIRTELDAIGGPVTTHAEDSIEWLIGCQSSCLDWIYIDTTHDYERTLAELRLACRAVKPGGIIAGHDFSRAYPGLVRAVTKFLGESGLSMEIYDGDLLPSYWIRNAPGHPPAVTDSATNSDVPAVG